MPIQVVGRVSDALRPKSTRVGRKTRGARAETDARTSQTELSFVAMVWDLHQKTSGRKIASSKGLLVAAKNGTLTYSVMDLWRLFRAGGRRAGLG